MKYAIGIVAALLLALGGYYAWANLSQPIVPGPQPTLPVIETDTYATSTFSIQHPSTYVMDDSYTYDQFKGKPIAGVKFSVPNLLTEGTNLSSDSGVSVEWLPRAQSCTGDIYVVANVRAMDLTVGSTTYSVATTSEASAGNRYEESVFALKGSKPCTALRYFIHYGAIENYPQEGKGAVREFDRTALLQAFDMIRDSLILTQ